MADLHKMQGRYFSFHFFLLIATGKKAPMSLLCMRHFLFLYKLERSGPGKELGRRKGWTTLYFCLWRIEVVDWNLPQPSIFPVCRSLFIPLWISVPWLDTQQNPSWYCISLPCPTKIFSFHCKVSEIFLRWNFAVLGNEGFICTFWVSLL